MSTQLDIYEDLAELIANMAPEKVVALKASPSQQQRLEDLLEKSRENGLSEDEKLEVERVLLLNRVISLAKIRARRLLKHAS